MTDQTWQRLEEMPFAHGGPVGSGLIRGSAEDFQVEEVLGFSPDGEGEHVLIQLRKRDTNTVWLSRQLAKFADVPARDVSYAGLKDRHAVTTQWFSVRLAGRPEPDWEAFNSEWVEVLVHERHRRKLKQGALRGNRFRLLIRGIEADTDLLEQRLRQLRELGFPNYFGTQRFGHDYGNLAQADRFFSGKSGRIDRKLRGLLISSVRSQLFNQVLAERIRRQDWDRILPGERASLDGSRSGFKVEEIDEEIRRRCREKDIHPSGPLWGRGRLPLEGEVLALEEQVLAPFGEWRNSLEHVGLEQDRRSLRVGVDDLRWEFPEAGVLALTFFLPAGSYATMLLRELLQVSEPAVRK